MNYIPLGLKQVASIFLLLGMGNAGPSPGVTGQIGPLWLIGSKGVGTKIKKTSWDDGTKT